MSWTSASVPAAEAAAAAADYPLLIGSQIGDAMAPGGRVRINTAGTWDAADAGSTTLPSYRAVDRNARGVASPASASSTIYYVFAATESTEFDALYIAHDNLSDEDLTITLARSNASNFGSPTTIVTLTSPINESRHLELLDVRVTGTGYVRLGIAIAAGTFTPAVREIWLGRRRQLTHQPRTPYAPTRRKSARAASGTISRDGDVLYVDRAEVAIAMHATDDVDTIGAWWTDTDRGRLSSILCLEPGSSPHDAMIVNHVERTRGVERGADGLYSWAATFSEQPPYLRGEM